MINPEVDGIEVHSSKVQGANLGVDSATVQNSTLQGAGHVETGNIVHEAEDVQPMA